MVFFKIASILIISNEKIKIKTAFSFTTPSPRMQIVNKQNQSPQWIESILVNICRLYIWGISYSKILDDKDNKKKNLSMDH